MWTEKGWTDVGSNRTGCSSEKNGNRKGRLEVLLWRARKGSEGSFGNINLEEEAVQLLGGGDLDVPCVC